MQEEWSVTARQLQRKAQVGVLGTLALLVLAVVMFLLEVAPVGIASFLLVFVAAIYAARTNKKYTAFFKEKVVRVALEEVFPGMTFAPQAGIPYETICDTQMMQMGDRYSSNDLITGEYHGVAFQQSDVHIEEESTDSDGHTQTTTLFRGRWMIFAFNKEFRCDMQILSKRFYAAKRKGGLLRMFSKKEERLKKVVLEDEAFNKDFTVYAQDEHEAFYILTPHMMQALARLREGMKAPIMLLFVGGALHIAVQNNKDAFEAKLFGKLDLEAEKQRVVADTRVITDFVDEMALDRDIYK